MKRLMFAFAVMFVFLPSVVVAAAQQEKVLFGPVKYDVTERYGKDNRYEGSFKAAEGLFVVEVRNGAQIYERSDLIKLTLNGQPLLSEDTYNYSYLACIVNLQHENKFDLLLKDEKPSGLKRPPLPSRFVTITVKTYAGKLPKGVYGMNSPEDMKSIAGFLQKIPDRESASLAVSSVNLGIDAGSRAGAMRRLSDRKDSSALPLMFSVFNDVSAVPEIRGEAAIGLGMQKDKSAIPALMDGAVHPNETIRLGSTRALSMFPEEDTREPLMKMLGRLDSMRMQAVIRAIINGGWKPVAPLLTLAESTDVHISRTAVAILGNIGDPRAADLLLKLLEQPGPRDIKTIIAALGETKDVRAVNPLMQMAADPAKRTGKEAELGEALAKMGNPEAAGVIAEMIEKTGSRQTFTRLQRAYKQLTGKEYRWRTNDT